MNDSIKREFDRLEETKSRTLDYLRSQPKERITECPPNSWSMVQAMRHIQMSEDLSLQYMLKKSQAGDDMLKRSLKPRLLLQVLFFVFAIGLRYKMPKMLAGPENTSLDELEKDWSETRAKIKVFIQEYPEKWSNKAVYKHPFVGMLNLKDTIRFFESHLNHHIIQIKRIDKMLKKS